MQNVNNKQIKLRPVFKSDIVMYVLMGVSYIR